MLRSVSLSLLPSLSLSSLRPSSHRGAINFSLPSVSYEPQPPPPLRLYSIRMGHECRAGATVNCSSTTPGKVLRHSAYLTKTCFVPRSCDVSGHSNSHSNIFCSQRACDSFSVPTSVLQSNFHNNIECSSQYVIA